jgi:hypothetical protein
MSNQITRTDHNHAHDLWDRIVEESPFLKNFLGPVKAQVDAMTEEQRANPNRYFMEAGKPK